MKNKKLQFKIKNFLIFLIFFLASILRVYKIAEYPAGLNADEAAIGYNAYCLIQTGKDEFGHSWPIAFRSFNDWKPGLYFYLVLPFVKIFGVNELAVRLPSAIIGALTVLIVYFLVKELFSKENKFSIFNFQFSIGEIVALILAISPWHLHFSRGGWETNAATFLITAGVYFFIKSLKNPKFLILSCLFFILSLYTYHSARVVVPVLILGLGFSYRRNIFKRQNFSWLLMGGLIGVVLVAPLAVSFFGSAGISRFSGVGLFADTGPVWRVNELRGQHQNPYIAQVRLLHNKLWAYGTAFLDNYFSHFSGDFLFISGDEIQRNKVPEMGLLYLTEVVFLPLGFYFLIRNRPKNWQIPLFWLAVAPLASSLTFQSPHAIRALNMVIPLVIIVSYGVVNFFKVFNLRQKIFPPIVLGSLFIILYLWNFAFYLHQYYIHYPKRYPAAWEYGFKYLVDYVKENQEKYAKIYVTDEYDQPYILFAFYLKYPPEVFQKEAKLSPRDKFGFSTVEHFGKYYFGSIDLKQLNKENVGQKIMVIGTQEEIPDSVTIIKRIYFKDGKKEAFRITEN